MAQVKLPFFDLPAQNAPLRAELLAAVERVLDHGQYILGPEVGQLEASIREFTGATHAVGLASGTDALRLALELAGIGPGDEVITVSHSFIATATAIALVGATPRFVDVDSETQLMDPALLEASCGPRTRAVLPVHLNGMPCDMDAIADFCTERGLALIEDCAQAIGTRYRGRHVGTFGLGAFSFHPLKTLGAVGDAGLITLSDDDAADRLRGLRNLGLRDRDHCDVVSSHSRIDTMQAALLCVKFSRLGQWIEARREHAAAYTASLEKHFALMRPVEGAEPAHSNFVIRHPQRDELIESLGREGFDLKVHYPIAIHRQQAFKSHAGDALPVTDLITSEIISLPCRPEIPPADRNRLIEALQDFARGR